MEFTGISMDLFVNVIISVLKNTNISVIWTTNIPKIALVSFKINAFLTAFLQNEITRLFYCLFFDLFQTRIIRFVRFLF